MIEQEDLITNNQQEKFSFGKLLFSGFRKFIYVIAVFVIINFFFQSYYVIGSSMNNTLKEGEFLLGIRKPFTTISRGDIITVKHDGKTVIKRLVGLPGDTVEINETEGLVVNGKPFTVDLQASKDQVFGEWVVSDGHVFIIGDNRSESRDSRMYGEVPENDITCKIFFRYFPFNVSGGL